MCNVHYVTRRLVCPRGFTLSVEETLVIECLALIVAGTERFEAKQVHALAGTRVAFA